MKFHTSFPKFLLGAFVAVTMLAVAFSARAGLAVPYTANADTLHLWHLNESGGPIANDSADLSTNASPIILTNIGYSSAGTTVYPFTNTSLGNPGPGFPGLTNAYSAMNKYHLLYGGSYPNVNGLCNTSTGAYTFGKLSSA